MSFQDFSTYQNPNQLWGLAQVLTIQGMLIVTLSYWKLKKSKSKQNLLSEK